MGGTYCGNINCLNHKIYIDKIFECSNCKESRCDDCIKNDKYHDKYQEKYPNKKGWFTHYLCGKCNTYSDTYLTK